MNRIIHFEIHSSDPEKAAKFYSNVFGWDIKELTIPGVEIVRENRYWHVTTGPETEAGVNGGLLFRRGPTPSAGQPVNAFVCTIAVSELDKTVKKVTDSGGHLALPRMPVPGVGWLAYGIDLDGNIFGIMQEDKNAK